MYSGNKTRRATWRVSSTPVRTRNGPILLLSVEITARVDRKTCGRIVLTRI